MINYNALIIATGKFTLLTTLLVSCHAVAEKPMRQDTCDSSVRNGESCIIALPRDAIQQIEITAGFGWGIFSGTIYNGNDNYHITRLIISMTPIHDDHHMHANMSHDPKIHQIDLDLPPISKGALSMALTGDDVHVHDFDWEILEIIGYQVR